MNTDAPAIRERPAGPEAAVTRADARGNFVVLRAGGLRLLLPHEDVGAAEYIEGVPAATAQPGRFELDVLGELRSIVALSEQLRALETFPAGRFVLTRLHAGGGELSFAWDEVRVLIDAVLEPLPLPPAMRSPQGPIDGYVRLDGKLLLCATAPRVLAYAVAAGE